MKMTAGELIKIILKEKNMNQKELAEKLGIKPQTLRNELYRNAFSVASLCETLDLLGYDLTATNRKTGETFGQGEKKFYNKQRKNTFNVSMLCEVLDILECDLTATNRKTGETINPAKTV